MDGFAPPFLQIGEIGEGRVLPIDVVTCPDCEETVGDNFVNFPRANLDALLNPLTFEVSIDVTFVWNWDFTVLSETNDVSPGGGRHCIYDVDYSGTYNTADESLAFSFEHEVSGAFGSLGDSERTGTRDAGIPEDSATGQAFNLHRTFSVTQTLETPPCPGTGTCPPHDPGSGESDIECTTDAAVDAESGILEVDEPPKIKLCCDGTNFRIAIAWTCQFRATLLIPDIHPVGAAFNGVYPSLLTWNPGTTVPALTGVCYFYTGDFDAWDFPSADAEHSWSDEIAAGTLMGIDIKCRMFRDDLDLDFHDEAGTHRTCATPEPATPYRKRDATGSAVVNIDSASVGIP